MVARMRAVLVAVLQSSARVNAIWYRVLPSTPSQTSRPVSPGGNRTAP